MILIWTTMYSRKRTALEKYRTTKRRKTSATGSRRLMLPTYRGFSGPRGFSKGEWKYVDTASVQAANTSGAIAFLIPVTSTTGVSGRIGNTIDIRSMELRIRCLVTPGTGVDQVQRFSIVLDKQCNAVGPTSLGQVYQTGTVYSTRNLENRKRFRLLLDKTFALNATDESGSQIFRKFYIKFRRPIRVTFNNNGGSPATVSDVVSNSLHLLSVGTEPAGPTPGQHIWYCRLRYTDA